MSSSKDAFFTRHVPNDQHCACLSNKSLSYQWVASISRHPLYKIGTSAFLNIILNINNYWDLQL